MYKNQLQELAQRSCFNLPAYACIREGPDHAPRFKATVNFNGEIFESPTFCSTLRQAEHSAAGVALNVLSRKGPSKALAARVLDETGVYKNLLQETAHRAGLRLPVYTTVRSGPGHTPVFSCTVELAGMSFTGETAKTKKQAQKNAAMTAWSALKKLSKSGASPASSSSTSLESGSNDDQEQVSVACYLASLQPQETNKSSMRFQHCRHSSAPTQRVGRRYDGNVSLSSLQHGNWAQSQISSEPSMCQAWLGESAYYNQNHLLSLSSLPTYSHRPQIVPFIHSVIQPDHRQYFLSEETDPISLVPGISPVLYFSMHPVPVPVKSISQVSIQEIEEKQLVEEWPSADIDSNYQEKNFKSSASTSSANTATNILGSLNSYSERRPQQRLEGEDEEKNVRSMPNDRLSSQLESNQHWTLPGFSDTRVIPQTISTDKANLPLLYPHCSYSLTSDSMPQTYPDVSSATSIRGYLPASFAAPVRVRTAANPYPVTFGPKSSNAASRRLTVSTCSRRPWLENLRDSGPMQSANFIAPSVHIRSVVPVCSTPPAKAPPSPVRESLFSGVDKNKVESAAETSTQNLDFGKLHI